MPMTDQMMADRALEADRARRAAQRRNDYAAAHGHRIERDLWLAMIEGGRA